MCVQNMQNIVQMLTAELYVFLKPLAVLQVFCACAVCSIHNQHFGLVRRILHTPVFKAVFFRHDCQITTVIK